jgi:hypothetical protein
LRSSQSQHLQQVDLLASRQHYIRKCEAALNELGKSSSTSPIGQIAR